MQHWARIRKILLLVGKLVLTAAGLWFVFRKIDFPALLQELKNARPFLLLLAGVFFILSKVISSVRLNTFFRCAGLQLAQKVNLKLYWLGMYYNLFLPGGIGGDGYKIYLLNKQSAVPAKKLIRAVFLDRLSGLAAILALSLLLLAFSGFPLWVRVSASAGIPLLYACYYLMLRVFFPDFTGNLTKSHLQSTGVQLAQTICVLLIMVSLGIRDDFLSYTLIFFVSSFAAVLPLTIGGVGIREVVFLFGARYFGLDAHPAVAISLLFFLITALISFFGVYFSFNTKRLFSS